jgi:glucose/mannose transport system substrate-binding protein
MKAPNLALLGLVIAGLSTGRAASAGEVEVLHFWTSAGEARPVAELKTLMSVGGHTWRDFAVVVVGGQNAMAALKQRVVAGTPPASTSLKGPAVQEWAAQGALTNLDAVHQTHDRSSQKCKRAHSRNLNDARARSSDRIACPRE